MSEQRVPRLNELDGGFRELSFEEVLEAVGGAAAALAAADQAEMAETRGNQRGSDGRGTGGFSPSRG
jgi:hypothetical protein